MEYNLLSQPHPHTSLPRAVAPLAPIGLSHPRPPSIVAPRQAWPSCPGRPLSPRPPVSPLFPPFVFRFFFAPAIGRCGWEYGMPRGLPVRRRRQPEGLVKSKDVKISAL